MVNSDLLGAGLELMLIGMSIVFVFLTILIGTMRVMSALAARLDAAQPAQIAPAEITVTDDGAADASVVAAITAAVARYRVGRSVH